MDASLSVRAGPAWLALCRGLWYSDSRNLSCAETPIWYVMSHPPGGSPSVAYHARALLRKPARALTQISDSRA